MLVAFLVPIALIDLDARSSPNKLTCPAALLAIVAGHGAGPGGEPERLIAGVLAGVALALPSLLHPRGMGMGDAKLVGVLGLYLGRGVAPASLVAFLAGALVGAVIMLRKGVAAAARPRSRSGRSSRSAASSACSPGTGSSLVPRALLTAATTARAGRSGHARPSRCAIRRRAARVDASHMATRANTQLVGLDGRARPHRRRAGQRQRRDRIRTAAVVELDAGVVRDGEVADADALAEALRELWREHRGLDKRVRIGVANARIVVRTI